MITKQIKLERIITHTSAFAIVYADTIILAVATPATMGQLALGMLSVIASGRLISFAVKVRITIAVHGGYNSKTKSVNAHYWTVYTCVLVTQVPL